MTSIDLTRLLHGELSLESQVEDNRFEGVTVGVVTAVEDEEHLGRVRVRFPYIANPVESGWARLATAWAGPYRGTYFVPEVDDEVLVAFQHGDMRFPYIVGCLWSERARPPQPDPTAKRSELRSRSGHSVLFDDTDGKQQLVVRSQGGHTVVLDDTDGAARISVADSTGKYSVVIDLAAQKISVSAGPGQISLEASRVAVSADNVEVTAKGSLSLKAGTALTLTGHTVKIN
jgi:uncharacterized protein involved in type VI secretion and phage assembly